MVVLNRIGNGLIIIILYDHHMPTDLGLTLPLFSVDFSWLAYSTVLFFLLPA